MVVQQKLNSILFIGFIVITFVTAIIVLLANIDVFGEEIRNSDFAKWGIGAVLAEIVAVTILAFKQSINLTARLKVNLKFPDPPNQIDLDSSKSTFEIKKQGKIVTGNLTPVLGVGGWQVTLPSDVGTEDLVRLFFEDTQGQKWEVRWFYPYVTTQGVVQR